MAVPCNNFLYGLLVYYIMDDILVLVTGSWSSFRIASCRFSVLKVFEMTVSLKVVLILFMYIQVFLGQVNQYRSKKKDEYILYYYEEFLR